MSERIVLLGCGHAHLSALRHWRGPPPLVVTRAASEAYSGLVPARLRRETVDADMRLDRAVAAAGGRLVLGTASELDLAAGRLRLRGGETLAFEWLSLDLGASSAAPPGAIPVRPASGLAARVEAVEAEAVGPAAVVGGGAAGTELALALALRWGTRRPVLLIADALLPGAPAAIRARALGALRAAGVTLITGRAEQVTAHGLRVTAGLDVAATAVFWAAGLVASPLPRAAGLACDPDGFVAIDAALRSLSHRRVFAVGDGAAMHVVKSGAYAIAAGRALADNLVRAAAGRAPHDWTPPRHVLAAIGIGRGRALAWRGALWLDGRPAWWLKAALDRHWMAAVG